MGAMLAVKPEHYNDVRHALVNFALHPFHIIVAESLEYLIEEALAMLPYKQRPRVKLGKHGRQEVHITSPEERIPVFASVVDQRSSDSVRSLDEGPFGIIDVQRTFLAFVPLSRDAQTLAQSTTEVVDEQPGAHYASKRGCNPRRKA